MRPLSIVIIAAALLAGTCAFGQEGSPPSAPWTSSQRVAAVEAARAQAELALIDHFWNVSLGSGKSVAAAFNNDPVAKERVAAAAGQAVTELGQPVFSEGQCQVQVGMSVAQAAALLELFRVEGDVVNTLTAEDVAALVTTMAELDIATLVATGDAGRPVAPRWQGVTRGASVDSDEYLRGRVKDFWTGHASEQGRVRAVMAAQDDAMIELAEKLAEVKIGPEKQTLASLVAPEDFATLAVEQLTNDVRPLRIRYYTRTLDVDVAIQANLADVLLTIKGYLDNQADADEATVVMIEDYLVNTADRTLTALGSAQVEPDYVLATTDPVFLLRRWVAETDVSMNPQALGTAELPAMVEDPEAARSETLAIAGFHARSALPDVLMAIALTDDDDASTLGDLAKEHEIVAQALMLLALEAETTLGTIDAEGHAEVTAKANLARLPVILQALRRMEPTDEAADD